MLLCKIHMPLGPWCCVLYPTKLWKFSTAGSWYPASMVTAGAGTARAHSFRISFLSFWNPDADTLQVQVSKVFLLHGLG